MRHRFAALAAVVVTCASLLLVGVADAGGFCSGYGNETLTDESGVRVVMEENCFTPTVLRVGRGLEVTFVNRDLEQHSVGGTAGSFGDMHKPIRPTRSVTYAFEQEGIYPYVCIFHPGMAGAIVVGDGRPDGKVANKSASFVAPVKNEAGGEPDSPASVAGSERASLIAVALGVAVILLIAALDRLRGKKGIRPPSGGGTSA
jgi:plastocyanin